MNCGSFHSTNACSGVFVANRPVTHDSRVGASNTCIDGGGDDRTDFVRDACGRVIERKYADDSSDKFEYDSLGRLVASQNADVRCEHAYDARGRRGLRAQSEEEGQGRRQVVLSSQLP